MGVIAHATPTRASFRVLLLFVWLGLVIGAYQIHSQVLDIGSGRDAPFIRGFSFRENSETANYRWTTGHAEIHFNGLGSQKGVLTLRLAAPREVGTIRVLANGELLKEVTPTQTFEDYSLRLDHISLDGNLVVTLASATFTQPPDTRTLGIQLDSAQFVWADGFTLPAPMPAIYLLGLALVVEWFARVWANNAKVGMAASVLTLLLGAWGFAFERNATAWFIGPLFWTIMAMFAGAVLFARLLSRAFPHLGGDGKSERVIFFVMLLALAVRMLFASNPGFVTDTQDYIVWTYKLVTYGLHTAYVPYEGLWIADQSPVLLYVIDLAGQVYRAVFAPDFLYPAVAGDPSLRALTTNPAALADPTLHVLLRIPFLLADILTGALVFALVHDRVSKGVAWVIALAYWFNPAVIWNGAYWGQTDALHTLLVVIAFVLLGSRRVGWAFIVVGVAAMTKPQSWIFAPLLLLLAYRDEKFRGVLRAAVGGIAGVVLSLAPMLLVGAGNSMLSYFLDTVGHHPILTANAHNLWWLLKPNEIDYPDTGAVFPNELPWLSYRILSLALFGFFYVLACFKLWRAPNSRAWLLAAFAAFAFFILPTEIHENYGFAALALVAVAIPNSPRRLALIFAVLTLTMVLNYALSDPGVFARLGMSNPDVQLAGMRYANSVLAVLLFIVWVVYEFVLPLSVRGMEQGQARARDGTLPVQAK